MVKISLRSEFLSGCVKALWQRMVEQNLDSWVGHDPAARALVFRGFVNGV